MEKFHLNDRLLNHPELVSMLATFRQQASHLPASEADDLWTSFKIKIEKRADELGIPKNPPMNATANIRIYIKEKKTTQEVDVDDINLTLMRKPERFQGLYSELKSLEDEGMIPKDTPTYLKLIELLHTFNADNVISIIHNLSSKLTHIQIQGVSAVESAEGIHPSERKLASVGVLSHKNIDIVCNVVDGKLSFKESNPSMFKPNNDCLVRATIETFKESYDKNHKKSLTHESFKPFLNTFTCSVKDITPFYKDNRLSLVAYDRNGSIVYEYHPEMDGKTRNKKISPSTCYIAIHNQHAHRLDKDIRSLASSKKRVNDIDSPKDEYPKIKVDIDNYYLVETFEEFVGFMEKIQDKSGKYYTVHYIGNMEELFFKLKDEYGYESDIKICGWNIVGLTIHTQNTINITDFPLQNPDEGKPIIEKLYYNLFVDWLNKFINKIFIPTYESRYSKNLMKVWKEYPRAQLHRRFSIECPEESDTIDIVRAYTKNLIDIDNIPVFNELDDFGVYLDDDIEDDSFYIIKNNSDDNETWFIANREWNMISGYVLRESGLKDNVEIKYVIRPSKLERNPLRGLVKELYESELPDSLKKFVVNMGIGLMNKKYNQSEKAVYTTDIEEASYFSKNVGSIRPTEYLSVLQSERVQLKSGFLPIGFLVYDRMRLRMMNLYRMLKRSGKEVYGIATDCMFVDSVPELEYSTSKTYTDLGKMHLEGIKRVPLSIIEIEKNNDIIDIPNTEFKNISTIEPRTIISGLLPGSGKTHMAINLGKKDETLVLVATNIQAERIRKEYGVESSTLCNAMGYVVVDSKLERKSSHSISKWKTIIVDEIFQQNIKLLGRLRDIMKTSDSIFYATGDEYQTSIPEDCNNIKDRQKYLKVLADMFPTRYWIESSKRLINSDIEILKNIKNDIFVLNMKPTEIIKKYGLKTIKDIELIPQVNLSLKNITSHIVSMKVHPVYNSDKVVCRVHNRDLVINREYKVDKVNKDSYVINGKEYKKSLFRYVYCGTIHSSQGSTINEPYCIFDVESVYTTPEVFWVAITRCSRLIDVMFWEGKFEILGDVSEDLKENGYCCKKCGDYLNSCLICDCK